jgi:putative acetyltransferase
MHLRPATSQDSDAIAALIADIYQENGEELCPEGGDADLLDIEASYAGRGGAAVVLLDGGKVAGCHATLPIDPDAGLITFRRLYLRRDLRGGSAGRELMQWALDWARDRGYRNVQFWSDTRFTRAHRFFERFGFRKTGRIRDMDDGSMPYSEFEFVLAL